MKNYAFILLIFFGNIATAHAQSDNTQLTYLNNYVNYLNETSHALWMVHVELESFNWQLNQYFAQRQGILKYTNEDFFNQAKAFAVLPSELYKICSEQSAKLPKQYQTQLNRNLNNINTILDSLNLSRQNLALYCKLHQYARDSDLTTAYRFLEACEIAYHDYSIEKDQLIKIIIDISSRLHKQDKQNPFVRTSDQAYDMVETARTILIAVKTGKNAVVKSQTQTLTVQYQNFIKAQSPNLQGLQRIGNNQPKDPYFRYDIFSQQVKLFLAATDDYLKNASYSVALDKGIDYYYYNRRLLSHFNRFGGGISYSYNDFIALSDVPILKSVDEPHWFKVAYPPNVVLDTQQTMVADTASLEGCKPANLVLLLDVSGSMNAPEKLQLLKRSFKHLLTLLRPEDYIAIVTYSGHAKVEVASTNGENKATLRQVIDNLRSGGGTNVEKGVTLSLKVAMDNYIADGNNRIILATDGGFDFTSKFYKLVEKCAANKVILSVVYLSKTEDATQVTKLKDLAQRGHGNYVYVNKQNARQVLLHEAQAIRK